MVASGRKWSQVVGGARGRSWASGAPSFAPRATERDAAQCSRSSADRSPHRSPSLQREMKSNMTAEAFVERHGPALLRWLQANTVECACSTPFGPDENLQRGTIDLTTSIACPSVLRAPRPA